MMRTMTAADIRRMLDCLRAIEDMTEPMRRGNIRPPTVDELYPAVAAAAEIRKTLLRFALVDVDVEMEPA